VKHLKDVDWRFLWAAIIVLGALDIALASIWIWWIYL
jgi:hypothetical protein